MWYFHLILSLGSKVLKILFLNTPFLCGKALHSGSQSRTHLAALQTKITTTLVSTSYNDTLHSEIENNTAQYAQGKQCGTYMETTVCATFHQAVYEGEVG